MRLKKLAILGFKSFADKTVLHFDKGITCIVGPNGCGKSNIADAFRWVLGEQSAKSLRGSKMPDVIFSGSSKRRALHFAEVSLTLTDIQGTLPLDYEEVTITRRLHRNGDSDYLLNNNPIRLKDLQTLFLDSGIGKNAFSIFEQGKLDQVISFTPYERRYIFEEAAGIVRFLQRKKETLKRLEETNLNLSRIHDIHKEVGHQVTLLTKQAEKARLFKEQQQTLENLDKRAYFLRWESIKEKESALSSKKESEEASLGLLKKTFSEKESQEKESRRQADLHTKELNKKSEEIILIQGKIETEKRGQLSLEEQWIESDLKIKKHQKEKEESAIAKRMRERELKELNEKQKEIEKEFFSFQSEWTEQQDLVIKQEKSVALLRKALAEKQKIHLNSIKAHHLCESNLKQIILKLESRLEKKNSWLSKEGQFIIESQKIRLLIEEKRKELEEISKRIDTQKAKLTAIEKKLKEEIKEIEEIKNRENEHRKKGLTAKTREQLLMKLREEHEGFSSGSKRLLKESTNKNSPLFGIIKPFYTYFEEESDQSEWLSASLRHYSQTLVVETEAEFNLLYAFAQKEKLSDFSLLCLEWLSSAKKRESLSFPLSKHFLEGIGNVDHYQKLLTLWQNSKIEEGWSSDGFFIDQRGVLFCIKMGENQLFMREAEIKSLKKEIEKSEKELKAIESSLLEKEKSRSERQLERIEIDKINRKDEMKLVEINFTLQRALADEEKAKKEEEKRKEEEALLTKEIESLEIAKQEAEKELKKRIADLDEAKREEDKHSLLLEEAEKFLLSQLKSKNEKGTKHQELSGQRQRLHHNRLLLESKEEEEKKQEIRIQNTLEEERARILALEQKSLKGKEEILSLEKEREKVSEEKRLLEQKVEKIKGELSDLLKESKVYQETLKKAEQESALLALQLTQLDASRTLLENELRERYALEMAKFTKNGFENRDTIEQIEKKMRLLKNGLEALGEVNFIAIQELESQQERFLFIERQLNDMESSKKALLDLIQELDQESRTIFQKTFEQIRSNFKKNFEILFNGGEADLELTDSNDLLQAGIEITAKPPGKQMRAISLLSGGEKCLTALALLFAIFEVRPSPFCILDEIDAPLDDTNVERFVNVVKHFVERCQFLIITHNKRTMAIGDVLFGVSMEEKGVSKLLSLEFAKDPIPEAALV